jgi:hypothetical protein
MEWRIFSPAKKKFKSAPSAEKCMLTLFWDMNGPTLEHCQERGDTVNSVRYSIMVEEKLKPENDSRRRGLLSKVVLLVHDNARTHTAAATFTTIQKLKLNTINNPYTDQTSLHPTIMPLACLRKHCAEDFTTMTR